MTITTNLIVNQHGYAYVLSDTEERGTWFSGTYPDEQRARAAVDEEIAARGTRHLDQQASDLLGTVSQTDEPQPESNLYLPPWATEGDDAA